MVFQVTYSSPYDCLDTPRRVVCLSALTEEGAKVKFHRNFPNAERVQISEPCLGKCDSPPPVFCARGLLC